MAEARKADKAQSDQETFGDRLARIRKQKGFTQIELAQKVGMIQVLISDYERGKLRPYGDVVARLALALEVSTDELLGVRPARKTTAALNRRFARRLQLIDKLPKRDQDALIRTIDAFLGRRESAG